jgi:hypothetical protein
MMGILCADVVTKMSSDIPLHREGACNASRIDAHKKMVSILKHKLSLITYFKVMCNNFLSNMHIGVHKCVFVCTIRAGDSQFGNSFLV